jgi:hypothetical protein
MILAREWCSSCAVLRSDHLASPRSVDFRALGIYAAMEEIDSPVSGPRARWAAGFTRRRGGTPC